MYELNSSPSTGLIMACMNIKEIMNCRKNPVTNKYAARTIQDSSEVMGSSDPATVVKDDVFIRCGD